MASQGFTREQKRWLYALIATGMSPFGPPSVSMVDRSVERLEEAMAGWEQKEAERIAKMFCSHEDCDQEPGAEGLCESHHD